MRPLHRCVLLLLVSSCSLLACSKSHGARRGENPDTDDAAGAVDETSDEGDEPTTNCPARGTRRAVESPADVEIGDEWEERDPAGQSLHAFSYTQPRHEDLPATQTTAVLQVRAQARTAVLIERADLPDEDPCRNELQLEADLILLTNDNAFRDVFAGTLSRTSEGTRFFAHTEARDLKGAYAAPEDGHFRVEALLQISEDSDGNPRESWDGTLWLDFVEGKSERTITAARWRAAD